MDNHTVLQNCLLSNFCTLIPVRLDNSNYVTWKFLLETLLRGCGLMKYIDGSFPCPPRHMIREAGGVSSGMTKEYMNWAQNDSAVMSLLAATLSSQALSSVVGSQNSWEVWKTLRERYGVSRSTAMQLKTNLYTIKKGSDTIDKYFERIKGITDQLATVGINIPDEEIIFIAVNCLPSEYKVIKFMIKSQLTSMSMNELRSFLLDEESIMDQPTNTIQIPHITTMVSGSDPCQNSNAYDPFIKASGSFGSTTASCTPHNNIHTQGFCTEDGCFRDSHGISFTHDVCQICYNFGHTALTCSQRSAPRQVVSCGSSFQCQICFQMGHSAAECLQRHHYDFQPPTYVKPKAMTVSFSSQPLPTSNATLSLPLPIENATPIHLLTSRLPTLKVVPPTFKWHQAMVHAFGDLQAPVTVTLSSSSPVKTSFSCRQMYQTVEPWQSLPLIPPG